jgi:glycosyltransferase 2 family protein
VTRRSAILRLLIGLAISAVFLGLTLSRVNLAEVGAAIAAASPAWLLVALGIVIVDVLLRAVRWQFLLHGVPGAGTKPPYRLAVGYLMIGFTANAILPARLGDIARAILAGDAFRTPRLAVFGTILIERLGDGLTMLLLALVSSIVVASGIAELRDLALFAIGAGIAGVIALVIVIAILSRPRVRATRFGGIVFGLLERVAAGAGAMTTVRGAATVVLLTWIVAFTAILVAWAVTNSVGLQLTPVQLVLFMSGIALSLAIPAAPGALGTYEFVGTAIITSLGYTAEQGLAAILLMRVITTFPPALAGLVSLFILQIRPGELVHAAEEPAPAVDPAR